VAAAGRPLPARPDAEAIRRTASAGLVDLRQSARGFRDAPTYWIGCTLTLALGIGATTTIATIVYDSILQPLPFPHPERIVRFGDAPLKNPVGLSSALVLNFLDLQRRAGTVEVMATFRSERAIVSGPDPAERLQGAWVTPNFFEVFELPTLAGRRFEPADQSSAARTVIISERAWRRGGWDEAVEARLPACRSRQRLPRHGALDDRAVAGHREAADQHVAEPRARPRRGFRGRVIGHRRGIEHHEIRVGALLDAALHARGWRVT
jgi:hypothetical protein